MDAKLRPWPQLIGYEAASDYLIGHMLARALAVPIGAPIPGSQGPAAARS
jgi:hypothetical protein